MIIASENNFDSSDIGSSVIEPRKNAENLILEALVYLRGSLPANGGTFGPPSLPRQKEDLQKWATGLDLILNPSELPPKVVRGGQEHELFHDEITDRYFKVTRNGVFGLSPGIDLALVSSAADPRRFHLWEANPIDYLERLFLQNLLVPDLNTFEGLIVQGDDMAIVTSQPRFDIVAVTSGEIDQWFETLGFSKITDSSYYRQEDNLGIFDAHDKNLVRGDEETLIPFDVIPCHPAGGFLQFINDTLESGHTLHAVRNVTTNPRKSVKD